MAKHFSISTETRDELSITRICNLKVLSGCLSMPDYIPNKQPKLNDFSGKDQAKGVFIIIILGRGVANTCI